jgi:hypothetical protein
MAAPLARTTAKHLPAGDWFAGNQEEDMKKGMRGLEALLVALVISLLAVVPANAAFDKGGVLGVGARPLGLGNAFTAIADEGIALHWNPAGLIQVERMELNGFFGPLLNGKELYFSGGFVLPFLEQTALGISVVTLFHDTGSTDTQAFENQYILGFATPLNVRKTVSVGLNLKFLQYNSAAKASFESPPGSGTIQTIEAKAGALGIDLGFLYQLPLPQSARWAMAAWTSISHSHQTIATSRSPCAAGRRKISISGRSTSPATCGNP